MPLHSPPSPNTSLSSNDESLFELIDERTSPSSISKGSVLESSCEESEDPLDSSAGIEEKLELAQYTDELNKLRSAFEEEVAMKETAEKKATFLVKELEFTEADYNEMRKSSIALEMRIAALLEEQKGEVTIKESAIKEVENLKKELSGAMKENVKIGKKVGELETKLERMKFFREEESSMKQAEVKRLEEILENRLERLGRARTELADREDTINRLKRLVEKQEEEKKCQERIMSHLKQELKLTEELLKISDGEVDRLKGTKVEEEIKSTDEEPVVEKTVEVDKESIQKKRDEFHKYLADQKKENKHKFSMQTLSILSIILELMSSIAFAHCLPLTLNEPGCSRILKTSCMLKAVLIFLVGYSLMAQREIKTARKGTVLMHLLLVAINVFWILKPASKYELFIVYIKAIIAPIFIVLMKNEVAEERDSLIERCETALASVAPVEETVMIEITKDSNGNFGFDFTHSDSGFVISNVTPNSDAELKGVKEGDKMVEINGVQLEGVTEAFVVMLIESLLGPIKMGVKRITSA